MNTPSKFAVDLALKMYEGLGILENPVNGADLLLIAAERIDDELAPLVEAARNASRSRWRKSSRDLREVLKNYTGGVL